MNQKYPLAKKGEQVHLFDTRLICASYHPNSSTRQIRRKASGGFLFGPPMFAALIVTLCNTLPGPSYCIEESVAVLPKAVCAIQAQFTLAEWKTAGKYRDNWDIASFRCEKADYVVKGRV